MNNIDQTDQKNILITKLGSRINTSSRKVKNGNAGENEKIVKLFLKHNVHLIEKRNKNPKNTKNSNDMFFGKHTPILNYEDNVDTSIFDVLVIIGGTSNFFGGVDNYGLAEDYKIINEFNGTILYFYTDPDCALKQIWTDNFHKRNKKWNTNYTKEEMFIQREDIIFISSTNTPVDFTKKPFSSPSVIDKFKKVQHFEYQKSVIFDKEVNIDRLEGPSIDLVYGGFYRGGARRKDMLRYMFDTEYSARFFGKISLDQFKLSEDEHISKYPQFVPEQGDWEFFKQSTNDALATIIFAEDTYSDSIITMRVYAAVLSNTVVFIDRKYDSKMKIFNNEFNYVSGKEEVQQKLKEIKSWSEQEYYDFCQNQITQLSINEEEFYQEFDDILNELVQL